MNGKVKKRQVENRSLPLVFLPFPLYIIISALYAGLSIDQIGPTPKLPKGDEQCVQCCFMSGVFVFIRVFSDPFEPLPPFEGCPMAPVDSTATTGFSSAQRSAASRDPFSHKKLTIPARPLPPQVA